MKRREFLKNSSLLAAGTAVASRSGPPPRRMPVKASAPAGAIVVDPLPLFDISPRLYMQFMEPLGTTDSSVEAAWSYDTDDWRKDFLERSKDLAPDVGDPVRWRFPARSVSAVGLECRPA